MAVQNNKGNMKYVLLILICLVTFPAYAKNHGSPRNQPQQTRNVNQFDSELFAKCNVCHKPSESIVVGNQLIPSYMAMSRMDQTAINNGIEHGGHLSNADNSKIYSVIHPTAESGKLTKKKTIKKAMKVKKAKKTGKLRKSKKRK